MEADIMNEEQISQTLLDQMVSSDRGQMIKAAIPYLPPKGQQIFSVYEKAVEFINTVSVFSKRSSGSDLCAMSMPAQNPVDIVNDIRSFCYVETMAVDVAADNHFLLAGGAFPLPLYILQDYNFVLIIHAA